MKYMFGKNPAAQTLETLVKDNPSARRKVMRLFSRYNEQLLQLVGAKDPETVTLLMGLLKDYNLARINSMKMDAKIKSYARNLIVSRYRVFLHEFEYLVPTVRTMLRLEKESKKSLGL